MRTPKGIEVSLKDPHTSSGGGRVRHILHVLNLSKTLFSGDFCGLFTTFGFFLGLSTLGIGFVQTITQTDSLGIWIVVISSPFKRLASQDILVGITVEKLCALLTILRIQRVRIQNTGLLNMISFHREFFSDWNTSLGQKQTHSSARLGWGKC